MRIFIPKKMSISNQMWRSQCTLLYKRVREAIVNQGQDVILDFSKSDKIEATAMLILVAELDRSMRMSGGASAIKCRLPDRSTSAGIIVGQVLNQIGLLERIGQSAPIEHSTEDFHESVKHWRYATGTRIDERPGDVLDQHEGRVAAALLSKVHVGLSEAIINSLHHAYVADREDGCKFFPERRWWMFTREQDGVLEVLVCDLGIGIPRSLPARWDRKLLSRVRSLFSDDGRQVAAIKTALILGQSSIDEQHRGKGLPQVWEATTSVKGGAVGIYSDSAYVGAAEGEIFQSQFGDKIFGTLVVWRLPIEASEDHEPDPD